jgi:hypothetical protein
VGWSAGTQAHRHGSALLAASDTIEWLEVAMIRVNHTGKIMDAEDYATQGLDNVPEVVTHVKQVRKEGMGVIAMKLAGEGTFDREDRRKAMRFAFRMRASIASRSATRALPKSTKLSRTSMWRSPRDASDDLRGSMGRMFA